MPRGLKRTTGLRIAGLVVLAAAASVELGAKAGARTPFEAYLASHPGANQDDLLGVTRGEGIGRVLAVLYHPDAGYHVVRLRVRELGRTEPLAVAPERLAGLPGDAPGVTYLVDLTQRCGTTDGPHAPDAAGGGFSSWLFLPGNRLAAWDIETFDAGCRPEPRQFDASDHVAMREVASLLYRDAARGRFRYGALTYEAWDDAFAAPTRASTLALLRKNAAERPSDARAQLHLAVAIYAAGDREGAIRALQRAAELDPRWSLPHENLAVAYRQRGELAAAERELALARDAGTGVASGPPASPEAP